MSANPGELPEETEEASKPDLPVLEYFQPAREGFTHVAVGSGQIDRYLERFEPEGGVEGLSEDEEHLVEILKPSEYSSDREEHDAEAAVLRAGGEYDPDLDALLGDDQAPLQLERIASYSEGGEEFDVYAFGEGSELIESTEIYSNLKHRGELSNE